MPDYDFQQLSPYDLEVLTRDLLQAHWGVTIESFKSGKDRGIDLRYAAGAGKVIVQVKHFARTGLAGLLRELKNEAPKVRLLQPSRYVVVTSVPLSAGNKDAAIEIIGADVLKPEDVIGREDLNNLLGQHGEIEGRHYKLWLASRAVLDRVLHNAVVTRSEFKVHQVYSDARRYVQSGAYPQALKMLSDTGVVIIAGPPGVGKTTLANLLLYQHLERGYQAVLIQRDIEEGYDLFQSGTRQVFYFDDFMGATFLGDRAVTVKGSNDRALLEFIAMIRATPTARLILTTREHVYAQAMDQSERLRLANLDGLRVVLRMQSYSFAEKARILYNHLYFSDLPVAYQDELLRDDFYLRIIKHEKFNPRIIEWLSSFPRLRNVPAQRYREFVENLLQDPSEIWRHAYEQEITDAGRSMLLAVHSFGGTIRGVSLQSAFGNLHQERARRYRFETRPEDFRSSLRQLEGAFTKVLADNGIQVIDPSVLDLLNAVVSEAPDNAVDIVAGAVNFDQIEHVWSLARSEKGGPVKEALGQAAGRLTASISARMLEGRRVDLGHGVVGYRGATFERRLSILIDMADQLSDSAIAGLITPLFERLQEEWKTESPQVNDAIEVLRTLDRTKRLDPSQVMRIKVVIEEGLVKEVSRGCGSDELREFILVMSNSAVSADESALAAARSGFSHYRGWMFTRELNECRSAEQYAGLIEDLKFIGDKLGVEVAEFIERVEEEKEGFVEGEDRYADHMQDAWKESWHRERATERSVAEMFGSLSSDRE